MIYLTGIELKDEGTGVARKILEQIRIFNVFGMKCSLCKWAYYQDNNFITKIKKRFPWVNLHKHWNYVDIENENFVYIRHPGEWDSFAVEFFKKIKKSNPAIKIVLELPTYPYDSELSKSWKNWPLFLKDKYSRRHLHKFIDRIATLTNDREIFGIPTLKIGNGINVEKIRPRKVSETTEVHAIAVANFKWWHGYERFIEGLKSYYAGNPDRKVYFHMVGHGSEFECYQKMIAEYGLKDYVILYDQQTGNALDDIYDKCNLGIASLGCYRKGMNETQELKSREYLAKGLPFVTSVKISDIPDGDKDSIYLQVANDDSAIDIEAVINFHDRIYTEETEKVNNRLRQFAKDHFSMEAAMKEVIDYFKKDE